MTLKWETKNMVQVTPNLEDHTGHVTHSNTETLDGRLRLYTNWCLVCNELLEYEVTETTTVEVVLWSPTTEEPPATIASELER